MGPLGGLGIGEIILIFIVVLLLFGAKRIPEIGSALGKGIREFKGSLREIEGEIKGEESRRSPPPSNRPPEVASPKQPEAEEPGAAGKGGESVEGEGGAEAGGGPETGGTPETGEGGRRTLTTSD